MCLLCVFVCLMLLLFGVEVEVLSFDCVCLFCLVACLFVCLLVVFGVVVFLSGG